MKAALIIACLGIAACGLAAPKADAELLFAEARAAWHADPDDEERIVWYGRRAAYLGRYEEAVAIYTDGLLLHPDSIALLRHRGHRFISSRRFEDAVADLERASALAHGLPDPIELDGMPNAAGIPRSTLHGNVEYHLALALQLQGRFAEAELAWRRALALVTNDDTLCAVLAWLQLNLREQGKSKEALQVMLPGQSLPGLEVLENFAYWELLRFDAGQLTESELLRGHAPGSVEHATRVYGLAARLHLRGEESQALELLRTIVAQDAAAAFGTIAAEAMLLRVVGGRSSTDSF